MLLILENKTKEIEYEIFTQDGFLIKKNEASEINFPLFFYYNYFISLKYENLFKQFEDVTNNNTNLIFINYNSK